MSCPGGTEPILSSRMPHKGATASQASKPCQDEALKLHEPHAKKLPGQFSSDREAKWKQSFLSGGLGRLGHPASSCSRNAMPSSGWLIPALTTHLISCGGCPTPADSRWRQPPGLHFHVAGPKGYGHGIPSGWEQNENGFWLWGQPDLQRVGKSERDQRN